MSDNLKAENADLRNDLARARARVAELEAEKKHVENKYFDMVGYRYDWREKAMARAKEIVAMRKRLDMLNEIVNFSARDWSTDRESRAIWQIANDKPVTPVAVTGLLITKDTPLRKTPLGQHRYARQGVGHHVVKGDKKEKIDHE